ncbi:LexA family protein [Pediococcus acidilactici]|uniref:LexA family protein n=1 Tax=Pediococcus acidilactici TaxID=1254 RepID=UPI002550D3B3|nr:S24 family peptidase [Pediococcus acidilactici]WIL71515.1 S24 family peptidase [Pediococcus acidilactici]
MSTDPKIFGSKLKELREKHRFTVRQVAKQADISSAYWSQLENGKRNVPKPVTLNKIADGLREPRDLIFNIAGYLPEKNKLPDNIQPASPENFVGLPVVGVIKAGPNGVAMEEHLGTEFTIKDNLDMSFDYFWLKVSGDSMIGDGINDGDYAMIKKTLDFNNGDICAVIVDGEEGTLKHITKSADTIVLTASNPAYEPRVFIGKEMNKIMIAGKLVQTMRKY